MPSTCKAKSFGQPAPRMLADSGQERLCIMCAERDPARCHRSLIADLLMVQGAEVIHLLDREEAPRAHTLHPVLRVEQGILRYAGGVAQGELF